MKNNYAKTAYCTSSNATGSFSARNTNAGSMTHENTSVIRSEKGTSRMVSFSLCAIAVAVFLLAVRIIMPVVVLDAFVIISLVRLIIIQKAKGCRRTGFCLECHTK